MPVCSLFLPENVGLRNVNLGEADANGRLGGIRVETIMRRELPSHQKTLQRWNTGSNLKRR
jgi:hypothetical protein